MPLSNEDLALIYLALLDRSAFYREAEMHNWERRAAELAYSFASVQKTGMAAYLDIEKEI